MHLARNVLAKVPKGSADMVAAAMRTIYAQPDAAHVAGQFDEIVSMLDRQFPDDCDRRRVHELVDVGTDECRADDDAPVVVDHEAAGPGGVAPVKRRAGGSCGSSTSRPSRR